MGVAPGLHTGDAGPPTPLDVAPGDTDGVDWRLGTRGHSLGAARFFCRPEALPPSASTPLLAGDVALGPPWAVVSHHMDSPVTALYR